jgi:molybdenum cofactor cytidylyltransferase
MTADRIAGVLLAAGTSSRMGMNKLFLELGGSTVLRRAVRTAQEAQLDPVLVVLGHERERAQAELAGLACTAVFNADYARGMNTSLSAGIAAVPADAAAAVVLLADMPLVTAAMVRELIERWRGSKAPLAISLYGDVVAPPILYGRELFPELRALDADACGKRVVKLHRNEALELERPAAALGDLDVPADLERARSQLEGA